MPKIPGGGKKRSKGCLIGCLSVPVIFVLLIIAGMVYSARDWRSDDTVLANYQPSAEIADIVEETTLTDQGKATLYRARPEFVAGEKFQQECLANGVESLACNTGFKIYLLQIDDPRFVDHKYGAAIHEMLHIAYRRLPSGERVELNKLLEQELKRHQDDSDLAHITTILSEAGRAEDVNDELHAKFGVEFSDLTPELESYYQQYFVNRSAVVKLFKQGGFDSRARKLEQLRLKADELKPQIIAAQNAGDKNTYDSLVSAYNATASESQRVHAEIKEFYQYFNTGAEVPQQQ